MLTVGCYYGCFVVGSIGWCCFLFRKKCLLWPWCLVLVVALVVGVVVFVLLVLVVCVGTCFLLLCGVDVSVCFGFGVVFLVLVSVCGFRFGLDCRRWCWLLFWCWFCFDLIWFGWFGLVRFWLVLYTLI